MEQSPLANTFTLGVRDLVRQRRFYAELGWPLVFESDDFAAFELRGAVLALFPVEKLGADSGGVTPESGRGGIRFSVIISVDTPQEVDQLVEQAVRAGARVTKAPVDAEFFEGRDAYFADPEDNFWEVAWAAPDNPVVVAARRAAGLAG
jgi:predicted lactoylglutathione lyase